MSKPELDAIRLYCEEPSAKSRSFTPWLWAAAMAAALATALVVDLPVARFIDSVRMRGTVRDLLNVFEAFGNGFGVLAAIVMVAVLDPSRRHAWIRISAASLGAGVAADVVKLLIARGRPHSVDLALASVWQTFEGALPMTSAGSGGQSFPSAHTATAVGLAVALGALYPRGRMLFVALAAGVGLQRVAVRAHFPSDALVGATLGWAWAKACVPGALMGARIDAWQDMLSKRFGQLNPTDAAEEHPDPATLPFRPRVAATTRDANAKNLRRAA